MKLSKTLIIFSLLMIFILNVNMASAFEFDNVKSYDPITREVTITNAYGLGSDIGKARLNTPLNYKVAPGYQKVAEFDLWAYQDYADILKSIDFYDKNQKDWEKNKIERKFDFKYKTYENILIDDFKTECSIDEKSANKTQTCQEIKVGSHYETQEVWKKINPATLKKNDVVTIGVFTNVQYGDYVEWIPQIYGVKVDEWATWTADLNVELVSYYDFEETSGSVIKDKVAGNNNLSTAGSSINLNYAGKLGSGAYVSGTGYMISGNIAGLSSLLSGTKTGTINMWYYSPSSNYVTYRNIFGIGQNTGNPSAFTFSEHSDASNKFLYSKNDGGAYTFLTGTTSLTNAWKMYSFVYNNNMLSVYENGVWKLNSSYGGITIADGKIVIGNEGLYAGDNNVIVYDELGIWSRAITPTEITQLYNSGTGMTYISSFDQAPNITLNSPSSANYTTSPQNIQMNFTAWDDVNLSDVKLYVNGILNQTNATGLNNTVYLFDLTLGDGEYEIYGKATDNESQSTNSDTITIIIDSQAPTINITYPLNGSEIVTFTNPTNVSFNASISDAHLSTCWYYNGTANVTVTCGNNATLSLGSGDHNLAWYANDTLGNEASEEVSFSINYIQANASYPNPAIEGETYPVNLTINATELNSLSGTLYYNGTAYNTTSSIAGSIGTLNTNLFIDAVNASTTKSFYWNYTLNGANYSSSTYNHTIYFINPINVSASCSAGLASAMCFDFKDELNLTSLSGDINYNFDFGISNSSFKEIYGSLTGVSNFCLCINSTVYNDYTLGEGEIQYSKTGYADRRFYTFSTQRLTNETINNTLYLLPSASATSFLFDFKDTSLAPYTSRYTTLLRWYPNLNEYKIVEMAKTDDKGETIMRVQVEDTDYRVGLYETNGSLITLLNPVRFACLSAPCSYSSLVDQAEKDYTSFFDVEGSIEFNETTNIWTLTWNDPSQNTDSMNLIVTRERGDSSYTICDVSASGFTGILTCDSTGYTGTLVAVAYRTASPATPIFQKIINTLSSPFASSVGLFFSFILVALLMLIGVYSPVASVILGILALLPALYMGVIPLAIFIPIACLGGIIIHFMKRTG